MILILMSSGRKFRILSEMKCAGDLKDLRRGLEMSRVEGLTSWYSDWQGLSAAILGIGVSGFAAADSLRELGVDVTVYAPEKHTRYNKLLDAIGARYVCAYLDELCEVDVDFVVVSPGISPDNPVIKRLRDRQIPILSEIELAWRVRDKVNTCPWILITGTNGKTTTALLTGSMLAKDGARVAVCGNIGTPVLDAVRNPKGFDYLVVELSSFQLSLLPMHGNGAVKGFSSACVNLDEDHLEWHGAKELYYRAKSRVYHGTTGFCVYNLDDEETKKMVEQACVARNVRAIGFGLCVPDVGQVGIVDGILCDRAFLSARKDSALEITSVEKLEKNKLSMRHIISDVLCAVALARSVETNPLSISRALDEFCLSPHRTEVVAKEMGVMWVNDSKATNPHAVIASLSNFSRVILIFGGLMKGVDVSGIFDRFYETIKAVVVIGKNQSFVGNIKCKKIVCIPDSNDPMSEAVAAADLLATPGDTVLLSPGGSSFDQFESYEHRGNCFINAVKDLVKRK
ncbi:MAG: UDP-N-acetylmuramoyl-L-alanine--D-glutamate ligase [Tropheryma whipplei]|uniref:UDP-N-acetylmuramoyl-L-alanine--D-glutamate ligase n=2 Tax=Tropheryma whipplei TaxID=2039 RepID=UPI001F4CF1CE|nr:UDP-N-acetylmuramoyl-L-alanine--D-glutamate ligase [Tropheryma whipplei]MCO8183003.1 UDP-N-acetylmuramoyl-L-alanine--D-glutamate ligase [Tropheryma whipplei]